MLKFERLNIVTANKIRVQLIVDIVVTIVFCVFFLVFLVFKNQADMISSSEQKILELTAEMKTLDASRNAYSSKIEKLAVEPSEYITKEQLVICIGSCAKSAGCAITNLSSKEVTEGQAVSKFNFEFELKGPLSRISKMLSNLDASNVQYSINTMSLRQSADYIWLQRDITDSITWWDLSNYASGGEQIKGSLTSEEILADTEMEFYVNLDFINIKD